MLLGNILSLQYKEVSSSLNRRIIYADIVSTNLAEKIINDGKIKFPDTIFSVDLGNLNEVIHLI